VETGRLTEIQVLRPISHSRISDLPNGTFQWRSYHHDTENIHTDFQVEISVDGGTSYAPIAGPNAGGTFSVTDSTAGGTPASSQTYDSSTPINDLPSTVTFEFTTSNFQEVILRFAPHSTGEVHKDFFVMNGLEITLAKDTDGDGLLDSAEATEGTNPNLADTDSDGFNDRIELREGTDPNNGSEFPAGNLPLIISEFLANNSTGIDDGNGSRSDWVEIHNPNDAPVSLVGYYLTDNATDLTKFQLPDISIPAMGYVLVFTSGDGAPDAEGNAHTDFKISADGEFLALIQPDGVSIDDLFSPVFPEQFSDRSYGRDATGNGLFFFEIPTPRAANGSGAPGVVKDTNFDIDRGFYDAPFELIISSDTPGAEIRYTLDGTTPTTTVGTVFDGNPIAISTTANVRAIGYLPGSDWLPTNVDTHSYIFVDDVAAQQPANPPGWPLDWGFDDQVASNDGNRGAEDGIVPSDYEMDPRVVNDDLNLRGEGYSMRDALLDIPTVSLTMRPRDFVMGQDDKTGGDNTSIYGTPRLREEKTGAIEYILPDGTKGFQEDVKIETHGNSSRTPWRMQKHSIRITFSTEVGVGKLRYNLFPESPVDTFNKLVLRACFTDSWALNSWSSGGATTRYRPNDSQYIRDVWMKDVMTEAGQSSGYGNFVHLYCNGLYFGIHNLAERIEDDWYAEHLGGEKEDWQINDNFVTPSAEWNAMMRTLNGNITSETVYEEAKTQIDVVNFADYMFVHFFANAEDWPHQNGYAAANFDSGDGRFRFQVWDQEIVLDKYTWNKESDRFSTGGYDRATGAGAPFQRLRRNEDFLMLFADRAFKHTHDGGALTADNASDLYMKRALEIDKAIIAESARWGDVQASTPYGETAQSANDPDADDYPPLVNNPIYFTREQHFIVERDHIVNSQIPRILDRNGPYSILNEMIGEGLYPSIDPPEFSQLGGVVPANYQLALSTLQGVPYYTLNGSDPRLPGGEINPNAIMLPPPSAEVIVGPDDSGWLILDTGVAQSASDVVAGHASYNASDWKHPSFDDSTWLPGAGLMANKESAISAQTTDTIFNITFSRPSTSAFRSLSTMLKTIGLWN